MKNILKWNVYVENFNSKKIEVFNVLKHYSFREECWNEARQLEDKNEFGACIKHWLMYHFWSKCEWEIILSDWPPSGRFNDKKISVFDQVMLNWDVFIEYLWNNRDETGEEEVSEQT